MTPESELPGSVRQDIQQIVTRAQARVSNQSVSATGQKLLRGMLAVLRRANTYDQLEQQVGRLIRDLDAGRAVLQGLLDEAVSAEKARDGIDCGELKEPAGVRIVPVGCHAGFSLC